ncbi:HAD hydrolase family protein [Rhizobium leguminosarum]|uniref:HAD hydrolase family protein n=1 Tax=Rhizobium leguminosarum TaxID=384 RepID=UPI001C8FC589|nr:HAD hydrolase family protein [Rhizobium leguminosarum]MBY2941875.1 HAD hydrolase family protein [Rhizobium leguminosarum]
MTIFAEKIRRLPETVALAKGGPIDALAAALRGGRGRVAIAIGSGGSTVTADYFARCRSTLSLGPTIVQTPMEYVLSADGWPDCEVWLFSAGANNPDIAAAFETAVRMRAAAIRLVTTRVDGKTALAASTSDIATVHVVPVADPKDGFIATHSMIAMVAALLYASDRLSEKPSASDLTLAFEEAARISTVPDADRPPVKNFKRGDTMIVLHDPQARAVATLIETSLWETGIAAVQRADFRNFAHGRHVWAAKYPDAMFVLAITAAETRSIWAALLDALPPVATSTIDLGFAGRFQIAVAILEGLRLIEVLGDSAGIDPGRPGRGPFAESIYDHSGLEVLARQMTRGVRHKLKAVLLHDPLGQEPLSVCAVGQKRLDDFEKARFRGVVLDYDGTIVYTDDRRAPPSDRLAQHLQRLMDAGVLVAIATGRGGSAGEMLRDVLAPRYHRQVVMGYYNGGHIRTLDIDIAVDQPAQNRDILEVAEWIETHELLAPGVPLKRGRVQLVFDHKDIPDHARFSASVNACPAVMGRRVKVLSSHHSFDILPTPTTKNLVVDVLTDMIGDPRASVLAIGDSGSPIGNDFDLLSIKHGVSVDSVCGNLHGSWSLFGAATTGPDALFRILEAIDTDENGAAVNLRVLELDT